MRKKNRTKLKINKIKIATLKNVEDIKGGFEKRSSSPCIPLSRIMACVTK